MAPKLDELVEKLVEVVAFSGTYGFDPADLRGVVESIHDTCSQQHNGDQPATPDSDSPDITVVNEEVIVLLRKRLEGHPEIELQDGKRFTPRHSRTSDSTHAVDGNGASSPSFRLEHSNKRLYATKERMWQTITGHGVDNSSISPRYFDCLSGIAAHGPAGVLQGKLTNLTGQDKHSVPHRTDLLSAKGYILKTAILVRGHETSLLRLKTLVEAGGVGYDHAVRPAVTHDEENDLVVDLAALLAQTVNLVKQQPDHVLAIQDLGAALGFEQNDTIATKRLLKCVRRLADSGCFLKCSAKPCDDEGAVRMREIKCVQLVREPTAADKEKWLRISFSAGTRARKTTTRQNSDTDAGDFESETELDELEGTVSSRKDTAAHSASDVPLPTLIFSIIQEAGTAGICSTDLYSRILGPLSRSSLDVVVAGLTSVSHTSQPAHLRHFSIVGELVGSGGADGRQFYTSDNYKRAVEARKNASGVAQGGDGGIAPSDVSERAQSHAPSEPDWWGFPKPLPELFAGGDGRASLAHSRPVTALTAQSVRGPDVTAVLQPKPIIRSRITSEKDQEEFELWAKATAETLARLELQRRMPRVTLPRDDEPVQKRRRISPDKVSPDEVNLDEVNPEELPGGAAFDYRVAEIEADILCRDWNGVYINPPGAKDIKAQYFIQKGRPRNAMIAVIKSERLGGFQWFKNEGVRNAPLASRRRTSRFVSQRKAEHKPADNADASVFVATGKETSSAPDASHIGGSVAALDEQYIPDAVGQAERTGIEAEGPPSPLVAAVLKGTMDEPSSLEVHTDREHAETPLALHTQASPNLPVSLRAPGHLVDSPGVSSTTSQAASTSAPDQGTEDADTLKTYSKAYILAHLDEDFHHVGNGSYERGPTTTKKRRRRTEQEIGEVPETVADSPDVPAKRTRRSTRSDDAQMAGPAPDAQTVGSHVAQPNGETAQYGATDNQGDAQIDVVVGRHLVASGSVQTVPAALLTEATHRPLNVSTNVRAFLEPPPRFDKAYVLAHKGEEFYHIGNGHWRRGTRPPKSTPKAVVVSSTCSAVQAIAEYSNGSSMQDPECQSSSIDQRSIVSVSDRSGTMPTPDERGSDAPAISATENGEPLVAKAATIRSGSIEGQFLLDEQSLTARQTTPDNNDTNMVTAGATDPIQIGEIRTLHSAMGETSSSIVSTPQQPVDEASTDIIKNGDISRRQTSLILHLIRRCQGAFPGNREIWYPLATAWEKTYHQMPQRTAVDRSVKGMVDSSRLKKITYSFQSKRGMNETRSILTLPDVDPTSERIAGLKKAIIDAFPTPYLPPEAEVSEALRPQAFDTPRPNDSPAADSDPSTHSRRFSKQGTCKDEFPAIEGLTVLRTQQGMDMVNTEREKNRNRQREWQERRKSRNVWESSDYDLSDDLPERTGQNEKLRHKRNRRKSSGTIQATGVQASSDSPGGPVPMLKAPPETIERATSSTSEWLLLSPGQMFLPGSGTFGTNGVRPGSLSIARPVSQSLVKAARKTSSSRRASTSTTYGTPSQRTASTNQQRGQTFSDNTAQQPTYDKAYVLAHPNERFQHVGNARWRLLQAQPPQPTPYNSLSQYDTPSVHTYPNALTEGSSATPSKQHRISLSDLLLASQKDHIQPSHELARKVNAAQVVPSTPMYTAPSAVQQPLQLVRTLPTPVNATTNDRGTPTAPGSSSVQTSRSGRPLYKSRKRKANAEIAFDENDSDVDKAEQPQEEPQNARAHRPYTQFPHADELVTVLALVKSLCAGVDQAHISWDAVAHAMGYKYEAMFLQKRWAYLKRTRGIEMQRLQEAIREPFLVAYAQDALPRVDFKDLPATDWPSLIAWVQKEVMPLPAPEEPSRQGVVDVIDHPVSSANLHARFAVQRPSIGYGPDLNRYFDAITDNARTTTALQLVPGDTLASADGSPDRIDEALTLPKSWCRAVAATQDQHYDAKAAAGKVGVFPDRVVQRATDELVGSRILSTERKGRQLPGRNFYLTKYMLKQFQRWLGDDTTYLREVTAARDRLMASFAGHQRLQLSYHTNDFEVVVLTNMVAQGHLKITTVLPPRNDDIDAPFPRLSIWGADELQTLYNSHATNKERLRFPVTYEKTSAFAYTHYLRTVPIPKQPALVPGDIGLRLPLWVDIHGNLIDELWDMVLRSILHLIVYRPGTTAKAMEKAHEGKLGAWEAEMVLQWMEETGLAISFGPGKEENGVWRGGWRASEWWYCAFAPEVATWKAP